MQTTSSSDESFTKPQGQASSRGLKALFTSRKSKVKSVGSEKDDTKVSPDSEPDKAETPTVTFSQMYKFATKSEMILNITGLITAACAGAGEASSLISLVL